MAVAQNMFIYDLTVLLSRLYSVMIGWLMNNKLVRLWPDSYVLPCICLEGLRKTSDRVVGMPAECQTGYLLSISKKHYHFSQLAQSAYIYLAFCFMAVMNRSLRFKRQLEKLWKFYLPNQKLTWKTPKKRTLFMTVHDFIPFIAKLFLTICTNLSLHYDSGEVNTYSKLPIIQHIQRMGWAQLYESTGCTRRTLIVWESS
jgi:hypothetical protein